MLTKKYIPVGLWYQQFIRLFWFGGMVVILLTDKYELHKKLNSLGTGLLDLVMRFYTHLGDGVFAIALGLLFMIKNIRFGLLIIISYVSSAIIAQLLKQVVFTNFHRPYYYFKEDETFRLIENFTYHSHHSFPSGHATSCFAVFTLLAYFFEEKKHYQLLFAFLAISVAFSRVYLSQHFLQDIIAGSMIGYFSAHLCWILLQDKLSKLDRPFKSS